MTKLHCAKYQSHEHQFLHKFHITRLRKSQLMILPHTYSPKKSLTLGIVRLQQQISTHSSRPIPEPAVYVSTPESWRLQIPLPRRLAQAGCHHSTQLHLELTAW
jgi:hypothetical protein